MKLGHYSTEISKFVVLCLGFPQYPQLFPVIYTQSVKAQSGSNGLKKVDKWTDFFPFVILALFFPTKLCGFLFLDWHPPRGPSPPPPPPRPRVLSTLSHTTL